MHAIHAVQPPAPPGDSGAIGMGMRMRQVVDATRSPPAEPGADTRGVLYDTIRAKNAITPATVSSTATMVAMMRTLMSNGSAGT